ncbi:MAG: ThiJ/PfpI family protein [Candidatus Binatia bacterium]|nr:MAG: ThiJ/PfpI family protein [Candidatus Binatia bacterium]
MPRPRELTVAVLVFPSFELLDVFGPLEVLGNRNLNPQPFRIRLVAERREPVRSAQGPAVYPDDTLDTVSAIGVLLVPGGIGTRAEVENGHLLEWIARRSEQAEFVCSVCTGAALLARSGVLDGRRATTNKRAFPWVEQLGPRVRWVREARWVEDGKFVTSSGVSAGIDMALALTARLVGLEAAETVARCMEYEWRNDPHHDPFAKVWGLV